MTRSGAATHPVAFWLLPAVPDHARLSAIVDALCREFDAPPFEPHLTLHVGECVQDDVGALLRRVVAAAEPMALVASGTSHSRALFKTLFVEFAPDPRPAALQAALARELATRSDYALEPHVSLLYKTLPAVRRAALARRFDFRGEQFAFDQIAAVMPANGSPDWTPVDGWRVGPRVSLARGA